MAVTDTMRVGISQKFHPERPIGRRYTTTVRILWGNYLVGVALEGRLGRREAIKRARELLKTDHSWMFMRDLDQVL